MRIAVVILALILTLGAPAIADVTLPEARSRVQAEFKAVIDGRQAYRDTIKARLEARRAGQKVEGLIPLPPTVGPDYQDTDTLMLLLQQPIYRQAVIEQLDSADPRYRGLACELLWHEFDPKALYRIGMLLGDEGECVCTQGPWSECHQSRFWIGTCSVDAAAYQAIDAMIGFSFEKKAAFAKWWKASARHNESVWYWRARWSTTAKQYSPSTGSYEHRDSARVQQLMVADMAGPLARLPRDMGLKIVLLVGNDAVCCGWYRGDLPNAQAVAQYVRDNHLRGRLLQLLQQKCLYPGITTQAAFTELAWTIVGLGRSIPDVFSRGDEPAFVMAEKANKPYCPPLSGIIMLRAAVVPDKAQSILREELGQHPYLTDIAVAIIPNIGFADEDVLLKSFKAGQENHRVQIAKQIKESAGHAPGVTLNLIARLAALQAVPEGDGWEVNIAPAAKVICDFALAANRISGRELFSKADIDAATPEIVEMYSTQMQIQSAHNDSVPAATRTLRSKLLTTLSGI